MGFGNIDFGSREKETEPLKGKCRDCMFWKSADKLCTKYNVISEAWKTCKSCKEKAIDEQFVMWEKKDAEN